MSILQNCGVLSIPLMGNLIPALLELGRWGAKHDAKTGAPMHYIRRIEKDREGFTAEVKSSLRAARERDLIPAS